MKGSIVVCVKPFSTEYFIFLASFFSIELPQLNNYYTVIERKLCVCGKHDNLIFEEIPHYWPDHHFKEVQTAGEGDEVVKEANTVKTLIPSNFKTKILLK